MDHPGLSPTALLLLQTRGRIASVPAVSVQDDLRQKKNQFGKMNSGKQVASRAPADFYESNEGFKKVGWHKLPRLPKFGLRRRRCHSHEGRRYTESDATAGIIITYFGDKFKVRPWCLTINQKKNKRMNYRWTRLDLRCTRE